MLLSATNSFVININQLKVQNQIANPTKFNPYENGATTISYVLSESATQVNVVIKDSNTIVVRNLITNVSQLGGLNVLVWDGKRDSGVMDISTGQSKAYSVNITAQKPGDALASASITNLIADAGLPVVSNFQFSRSFAYQQHQRSVFSSRHNRGYAKTTDRI